MMLTMFGITLLGLNDTNKKVERTQREGAPIQGTVTALLNP